MSISQIAEGWFNSFLDALHILEPEKKQIAENRIKICKDCPVRSGERCDSTKTHTNINRQPFNGCGCRVEKKVLCMGCVCPGGFW
jgi:hypothetical protein